MAFQQATDAQRRVCVLHCTRSSEMAGIAAAPPFAQALYRCGLGARERPSLVRRRLHPAGASERSEREDRHVAAASVARPSRLAARARRVLASVHGCLMAAKMSRLRECSLTLAARMPPLASVHGSLVGAEVVGACGPLNRHPQVRCSSRNARRRNLQRRSERQCRRSRRRLIIGACEPRNE